MKEEIYVFSQYTCPKQALKLMLAGISYCDSSYKVERADYNHYVIEHVLDGEGVLEADGQIYELKAGDTYFLYRGKGHKYYCRDNFWNKIWIVVDGRLAEALFDAYLPGRPAMLSDFDIQDHMQYLLDLARDKALPYEELTAQTAVTVHKILVAARDYPQKKADPLPAAIRSYLDDHLDNALKLDDLARTLNYSKNHLINVFRDAYGMPPYAYYETQKMMVARDMLANSTITIREISEKLGFDNPQYFSKSFKKKFQISPRQFRQK